MSIFSAIAPSSKSIQKEYVDKRLRHLKTNKDKDSLALQQKIIDFQRAQAISPTTPWTDTYAKLLAPLLQAELTINLDAGDWFMKATPNTFTTYAQGYEKALQSGGGMALKDDEVNKAGLRAIADDLTTLPDEWANAHPWSQRKRLHKALSASGATAAAAGALKRPDVDPLKNHKLTLKGDGINGMDTTNKHFKPKAREVFAALNYGRREHGSNTTYGFSYIVLAPELKKRALYYPADTFYLAARGTSTQASYETLGSVLLNASPYLIKDLWSLASGRVQRCADTHQGMLMIEAHIFKRVKIATDVKKLVLARPRKSSKTPFTEAEWTQCVDAAQAWGRHFGVTVQRLD